MYYLLGKALPFWQFFDIMHYINELQHAIVFVPARGYLIHLVRYSKGSQERIEREYSGSSMDHPMMGLMLQR